MTPRSILAGLRRWAREVKRDVIALYLAARDPRVPWMAKAVAACVVAYALSPIDLIPDFIPVLGYLDDAILVPLGILLAVRLVPVKVMAELRKAADRRAALPRSRAAAVAVIVAWIAVSSALVWWVRSRSDP